MVQVATQEEAAKAIELLNGQASCEVMKSDGDGHAEGVLQVSFAGREREPSDNLYVAGLPSGVDLASLNEMFTNEGLTVQRSRINPDTKGLGVTSAFVQVDSIEEANKAIETFTGQTVKGP